MAESIFHLQRDQAGALPGIPAPRSQSSRSVLTTEVPSDPTWTAAGCQAQTGKAGALTKCHSSLSVSRSSLLTSQDLAQCFVGFQGTGNPIQVTCLHSRAVGTAGLGSGAWLGQGGWSRRMGTQAGTRHMSDLKEPAPASPCVRPVPLPKEIWRQSSPSRYHNPAQAQQVSLPVGLLPGMGQRGVIPRGVSDPSLLHDLCPVIQARPAEAGGCSTQGQ